MVIVKTIQEFQKFVAIADNQGIKYTIICSEKESYEGIISFDKPSSNIFSATYILFSSLFTVMLHLKDKVENKSEIKLAMSAFNITPFKQIHLDENGNISCND